MGSATFPQERRQGSRRGWVPASSVLDESPVLVLEQAVHDPVCDLGNVFQVYVELVRVLLCVHHSSSIDRFAQWVMVQLCQPTRVTGGEPDRPSCLASFADRFWLCRLSLWKRILLDVARLSSGLLPDGGPFSRVPGVTFRRKPWSRDQKRCTRPEAAIHPEPRCGNLGWTRVAVALRIHSDTGKQAGHGERAPFPCPRQLCPADIISNRRRTGDGSTCGNNNERHFFSISGPYVSGMRSRGPMSRQWPTHGRHSRAARSISAQKTPSRPLFDARIRPIGSMTMLCPS